MFKKGDQLIDILYTGEKAPYIYEVVSVNPKGRLNVRVIKVNRINETIHVGKEFRNDSPNIFRLFKKARRGHHLTQIFK